MNQETVVYIKGQCCNEVFFINYSTTIPVMEGEYIQIKRNEGAAKLYFAVRNKLLEIMKEKLKVDESLLNEDNFRESLTGQVFNLAATDLLYLFFKIEEETGCIINAEDICCYEFNTIQGILDNVSEAVLDGMH